MPNTVYFAFDFSVTYIADEKPFMPLWKILFVVLIVSGRSFSLQKEDYSAGTEDVFAGPFDRDLVAQDAVVSQPEMLRKAGYSAFAPILTDIDISKHLCIKSLSVIDIKITVFIDKNIIYFFSEEVGIRNTEEAAVRLKELIVDYINGWNLEYIELGIQISVVFDLNTLADGYENINKTEIFCMGGTVLRDRTIALFDWMRGRKKTGYYILLTSCIPPKQIGSVVHRMLDRTRQDEIVYRNTVNKSGFIYRLGENKRNAIVGVMVSTVSGIFSLLKNALNFSLFGEEDQLSFVTTHVTDGQALNRCRNVWQIIIEEMFSNDVSVATIKPGVRKIFNLIQNNDVLKHLYIMDSNRVIEYTAQSR